MRWRPVVRLAIITVVNQDGALKEPALLITLSDNERRVQNQKSSNPVVKAGWSPISFPTFTGREQNGLPQPSMTVASWCPAPLP